MSKISDHHLPSATEQAHINQALEASQTAIDAISTTVAVSSFALTIIGLMLGLIAIVGWSALKEAASEKAKQIANKRLDSYMASDEFRLLMQSSVDLAVKAKWQDSLLKRLEEVVRSSDDEAAFPVKEGRK